MSAKKAFKEWYSSVRKCIREGVTGSPFITPDRRFILRFQDADGQYWTKPSANSRDMRFETRSCVTPMMERQWACDSLRDAAASRARNGRATRYARLAVEAARNCRIRSEQLGFALPG